MERTDGLIPFDVEHFPWLGDPAFQREMAQLQIKHTIIEQLIGWTRHIPVIGVVVHTFWFSLLDDGIRHTCAPRWGAMTFAFLNDGMRPTLWHTWRSIVDPDEGIWVGGAPRSAEESRRRLRKYPDCTSPVTEEDSW